MSKLKNARALAAAAVLGLQPFPVHALGVDAAAIVAAIAAQTAALTLIIRETVAEAAVGLGGVVQSQVAAIARLIDGKTAQDMDLAKRGQALEVTRNSRAPINECRTATIASQTLSAENVKNRALRLDLGRLTEVRLLAQDGNADARRLVKNHLAQYAGGQDVTLGMAQSRSTLPNADIQAISLLDGAGRTEERALTFNPQQAAAARAYLENAYSGIPSGASVDARSLQTEQGTRLAALLLSEQASLSMSYYAANEVLSSRLPVAGLGAAFGEIWKTMRTTPPDVGTNVSEAEIMKLEATRRYSNPAWYVDVAGMQTPIQVQKEQAHVLALIAHQNQKLLEKSETSNLLLAQIASVLVKQSYREPIATAARNVTTGR